MAVAGRHYPGRTRARAGRPAPSILETSSRWTASPSRSPRGGSSGSSGATARARPPRCGSRSGCSKPTRGRCAGAGRRWTPRPGAGSATCRRSAASTRRCACSSSSSIWRGLRGMRQGGRAGERRAAARRRSRWSGIRVRASSRSRSGTSSACSSRRRSCTSRSCWSWTSRSPGSIPSASTCCPACCAATRARDGAAVVFSSHQLDLVERLCDEVVLIDHGRVAAKGTIDELRASRARNLWRVGVRGRRRRVVGGHPRGDAGSAGRRGRRARARTVDGPAAGARRRPRRGRRPRVRTRASRRCRSCSAR